MLYNIEKFYKKENVRQYRFISSINVSKRTKVFTSTNSIDELVYTDLYLYVIRARFLLPL